MSNAWSGGNGRRRPKQPRMRIVYNSRWDSREPPGSTMDFHLPELGEGVYEAEMSRWLVKEGAEVNPGQPLFEVLTDKATMEVPAPFSGAIDSLLVQEGDKV